MQLWRADGEQLKPVLVDCPNGLYPSSDAEGHPVYVNSHFHTEEAAWKRLFDDSQAGVCLAGGRVIEAEKILQKAQEQAAAAAKEYKVLTENYSRYKVQQIQQGDTCAENPT